MSREFCDECGSTNDLIPNGFDDYGGEPVQMYICASCAQSAELGNWISEQMADEERKQAGEKYR